MFLCQNKISIFLKNKAIDVYKELIFKNSSFLVSESFLQVKFWVYLRIDGSLHIDQLMNFNDQLSELWLIDIIISIFV